MIAARPIWLASASPRRRQLLAAAGVAAEIVPPDIDDAGLAPGDRPAHEWVVSMAHLKARRVSEILARRSEPSIGTILAADTVCAVDDHILGQPRDAADARRMLCLLRGRSHQTLTGVCLFDRASTARTLWYDAATVTIGPLDDAAVDEYVASGRWRGKAGAYNLEERIDAGWPIECIGDPTTVMGLPMRRLAPMLAAPPAAAAARRSLTA